MCQARIVTGFLFEWETLPLKKEILCVHQKKPIWSLSLPPVFKIINIARFLSKDRFIKMVIFEGE